MPYRFDSFVFDKGRGLLENGEPVPLEPRGLDLLGYLLEHRGRVVSRDELNEEIWDGRIVSEAALSTCVRAVRRGLGDDRTQQKYIRTYPKRGFQFVAPVDLAVESGAVANGAGHIRPQSRRKPRGLGLCAPRQCPALQPKEP